MKEKDVVDIMFEARNFCTNASEDMFVCFLLGATHSFYLIKHMQQMEIKKKLALIDKLFGE